MPERCWHKLSSFPLKRDQDGGTSTKTVTHLGAIASPHPASILKTFSRQKQLVF
jgi:hypothetical protein